MQNSSQPGGANSRQSNLFRMESVPTFGPVNSVEPDSEIPFQEPYEPVTNINPSPAVKPGESTFPTGSSNHSGIPEEPVGSLYAGGDDDLDPEGTDDDAQIVTSPDEDEEIERIEEIEPDADDLEDIEDLEDEELDEEFSDDEEPDDESGGDVGEPRNS